MTERSSISGRPALTSRIWAPAASWAMASPSTWSWLPLRSASFILRFPVGLMRSPMTPTWPGASAQRPWGPHTAKRSGSSRRAGTRAASSARSAATCAGVVPQQPPTMVTPASSMPATAAAYSSGPMSKTVWPSTTRGRPALAWTITGQLAHGSMRDASGATSAGPSEQLMPTAAAPSEESVSAATSGVVPRNVRPSSWKVIVTRAGRSEFSRTARRAALASARSAIVSMTKRSAPAASAARTWRAKSSYASSKGRVPMGARSWPVGPMSAAT